jgi:hypothetical protein
LFAVGSVFIENRSANGSATSGSDGLIVWSNSGASGFNSSGALFQPSDRNSKKDFTPVDGREVLEKVAAMPVSTWHYKNDDKTLYMGPMAQDFYANFGLGDRDTVIHGVNADGVALAAIQGLNAKLGDELKQRDLVIEAQKARIAEMESRVARLEEIATQSGFSLKHGAGLGMGVGALVGLPILGFALLRRRKGQ